MTIPTSSNLIHIILEGIAAPEGEPGRSMPGYGEALSNEQVRDLVTYIRAYFGRAPPWPDVDDEIRKIRRAKASAR
jgi:mono/diheme cytochrome c family protein